jgi:hypothetical protein
MPVEASEPGSGAIFPQGIRRPSIDLDRLLKLRLVVARFGEMDLARWWNTKGQLGRLGFAALRRGFPRTHYFAHAGKRISLADCLDDAMSSQRPLQDWFAAERDQGTDTIVETVHSVLSEYSPLVDLVAHRMPDSPNPLQDIVFIVRTGALFSVYRTFSLLEQLKGRVSVPTVLFYPGDLDGAAGL